MLKRSNKSRRFVPVTRGKAFSLHVMLAVGFMWFTYQVTEVLFIPTYLFIYLFISWKGVGFYQMLFVYWDDIQILYFNLLICHIILIDSHMLNQSYIPEINPSLILFICCWIHFASILLRIFVTVRDVDL